MIALKIFVTCVLLIVVAVFLDWVLYDELAVISRRSYIRVFLGLVVFLSIAGALGSLFLATWTLI